MSLPRILDHPPEGWLAFELSILRRLRFRSMVNPFAGEASLDAYVQRWGVRVSSNDAAQWAWVKALARVENNSERLSPEDVEVVLEDAYVPRYRLSNPALRNWFNETDAWWFDNVRENAEKMGSPIKRALALNLCLMVGDYALSFDEETRELRQPLSRVFKRLADAQAAPVDNHQPNKGTNREARDFLAGARADLLFLRLPRPERRNARYSPWAWREEWVRGADGFWNEFEGAREGRLGARAETKQQYLRHVEELLATAAHLPVWAVTHVEDGFISTEDLVETMRHVRKVGTIYSKDFSELMGVRAAIITA